MCESVDEHFHSLKAFQVFYPVPFGIGCHMRHVREHTNLSERMEVLEFVCAYFFFRGQ